MSWWIVRFSRAGRARYLSHLDTARVVQRTFARAAVPVALSQGMRPKPRISLPLPLPVGAAGAEELAVVEVAPGAPVPALALRALRAAAPTDVVPLAIADTGETKPHPLAVEAEYACVLDGDAGDAAAAVERYGREDTVRYERTSPKGTRSLDLKEYVVAPRVEPGAGGTRLVFTVRHRADGAARPQEFVDLIARWAGIEPTMRGLERRRIVWTGVAQAPGAGPGRSVAS